MVPLLSVLAAALWISASYPLPRGGSTLNLGWLVATCAAAGLVGLSLLFDRYARPLCWFLGKAARVVLALGLMLTLAIGALGGWSAMILPGYLSLGGAALLVLGSGRPAPLVFAIAMLVALSAWSWGSAFALKSHRGAPPASAESCVLLGTSYGGYARPSSIFALRGPYVVSEGREPGQSYTWQFHALWLDPQADPPLWNWSIRRMRFEPIKTAKAMPLPTVCPAE